MRDLEKLTHNILYHKKHKIYIVRGYDGVSIHDDKNVQLHFYHQREDYELFMRKLNRKCSLEELLYEKA